MPARGSLLRWAKTQQMSVGTLAAKRLPPHLLRPFSRRTICRSVSFRLCSITRVRIQHHAHFVEQYSFVRYRTTAMQVTINAKSTLALDKIATTTSDTSVTSRNQQQAQCKGKFNMRKRPVFFFSQSLPSLQKKKKKREAVY